MADSRPPIKGRYTNTDVMAAIGVLHDCLDDHRRETRENTDELKHEIGDVRERVATVEGQQSVILGRVGGPMKESEAEGKIKPVAAFLRPWKVAWLVAMAVAGGGGVYRLGLAVFEAVNHYLLTAPLPPIH
jgi:hypothetical protein